MGTTMKSIIMIDLMMYLILSLALQNIYIKAGFIQSPSERLNLSNPSV